MIPTLNIKTGRILLASTRNILTRAISDDSTIIGTGSHEAIHDGRIVDDKTVLQREGEGVPQRTDDYGLESEVNYPVFITEEGDYIAPEEKGITRNYPNKDAAFVKEDEYEGYDQTP
jgi:hypothetical protein